MEELAEDRNGNIYSMNDAERIGRWVIEQFEKEAERKAQPSSESKPTQPIHGNTEGL